MDILQLSFLGLVAGWIASVAMNIRSFKGVLMDIILGVFGAIAGGILMKMFGAQPLASLDYSSALLAAAGAGVWILVGHSLKVNKDL